MMYLMVMLNNNANNEKMNDEKLSCQYNEHHARWENNDTNHEASRLPVWWETMMAIIEHHGNDDEKQ